MGKIFGDGMLPKHGTLDEPSFSSRSLWRGGQTHNLYSNVSKCMAKIPDTETINATQNGLYPSQESCVIWYLKEGYRVLCNQGRSMKGKSWNWSCLKSLNGSVQIF